MEPTYYLAKAIIKPWVAVWLRCSIEGVESIPREGPAIIAFNHISYLDPFVAAYVVDKARRRPRFLAKGELFDDKRVAWILKGAKQIEVRRGTRDAPVALDHALDALDRGQAVVIFPEGTITDDPDLKPMAARSGAARLALSSGAPLIPAALWGTQNLWPKGYAQHWWPPGQDVVVRVGEPMKLSPPEPSQQQWQRASVELMERISMLVAGLVPAVPDRRRPKRNAA
jgi:1-acyl-sn-glycerol-3-phosphate acyltransferase